MEAETKVCVKCNKPKPIEQFYFAKSGNRLGECSSCKSEYHRAYRAKNREILEQRKEEKKLAKTNRDLVNGKAVKFKPGKCSKRSCHEPKVEFEGIIKFCKSHAYDYIFCIDDV